MEEKFIIRSKHYNIKWLLIIVLILIDVIAIPIIPGFAAGGEELLILYGLLLLINIAVILIKVWLSSYEMVVTDKRVYGKIAFGKRVDLPLDSISATSTLRVLKGVSVSTSSGIIKFLLIKNSNEMYEEISKLLLERQNNSPVKVEKKTDTPDDLIKLKELLDKGIITQEEFDTKKKQILGL